MSNGSNTQELKRQSKHMKWLVMMLCLMLGLSTLSICSYALVLANAISNKTYIPNGADSGFVAVTAAIFGVLMTGVFVFMTFRIDRGAIIEARSTAEREAKQVLSHADAILRDAQGKAKRAAQESIEEGKAQILAGAREDSERIALSITIQLRNDTIECLKRRNPVSDSTIPRPALVQNKQG